MNYPQDTIDRLRKEGYRLTPQRLMILNAIEQSDDHISAEEIHTRVTSKYPNINISTVYRTLELLKELGLVYELDLGAGQVRYHPAEKGHHHHLVCQKCGTTIDIDESILARLQDVLLSRYHFDARIRHMAILGLCEKCQKS